LVFYINVSTYQPINRILFLAEGHLGDSLVLLPALKAVKECLPGVNITVLSLVRKKYSNIPLTPFKGGSIEPSGFSGPAEIFKNNPCVDELLELDRGRLRGLRGIARLKAELKCISFLRKKKFDAVICTFPQDRLALWSFFSGSKIRIGQKKWQSAAGFLLTHRVNIDHRSEPVIKYHCKMLEPLGVECNDLLPRYEVPEEAKRWAENVFTSLGISAGERAIAIHPGASEPDRQWHPRAFGELIRLLTDRNVCPTKVRVILCGGEFDAAVVEEIGAQITNLCCIEVDSVSRLAAILQRCDVCVTNNSGPRHLAAAVGTKTVAVLRKYGEYNWEGLYEDENSHRTIKSSERCPFCPEGVCNSVIPEGAVYGAQCMHGIKAEEVAEAVESLMS
jgi:ADP-heptose:LPS heptosyltransferase